MEWAQENIFFSVQNKRLGYFFILWIAFFACTKENIPKTLKLGNNLLTVDAPAGSTSVSLTSNTSWSVLSTSDWLSVTPASGTGNSILSIAWNAMTNMDQRTGSIIVQAGNLQQKIEVSQEQRVKLLQTQVIMGNLETSVRTSVVLTFNTNVDVSTIVDNMNLCAPVDSFKVSGSQVSFPYPCTTMGMVYPFTISLKNGYNFTFQVSLHKSKLNVPGQVFDYFVTDDNSSLWAVTQNPNQLVQLSLPDLSLLKKLSLAFRPERIRWNYYHDKLMVFAPAADDSVYRIVDPVSLSITKVRVSPYNPQYSSEAFFPSDIAQMSDGNGIMQTELYSGYYSWRYINKNDSTWPISNYFMTSAPKQYGEIHTNYDRSKVIMLYAFQNTNVDVWQMGTDTLHTIYAPNVYLAGVGAVNLCVNKKQDLIFHSHSLTQYITDLSGYVSGISYLRDLYKNSAFSYRSGEDQVIYNVVDGTFYVMDYQNSFTNLSALITDNFSRLQSTTDGKYIVGYNDNVASADFLVFDLGAILVNSVKYSPTSGGRIRATRNSGWALH
ncbi:MAG: hypothetical protein OJF59_000649 [Cytophagales bacterium]|jgi:hypothetical protein|nr:BACON domain-containing protein [Bacteroidota bacterium]MBS1558924.1 BACON domain-containing protein [Bacteroidota bacterium]MBS1981348.1 BACON domain-containing protein [Bacteroidota bacterium]WHZ06896.1 MAG: hypothetical protein OJF59_000649 [Cytophagales bacterium]